jgi:transposase
MYLHTKKQQQYFDEVIRLHYQKGYGEDRISQILPIGHSTVSRWIGIFAAENKEKAVSMRKPTPKPRTKLPTDTPQVKDVKALEVEIARLHAQRKAEKLRADAYDEMINVAESKFRISIRKKVGAKQ